ncbi:MAG: oligopeptide transporter, OPT family [Euryarchaeota archaeon]|nr:oligopeptide transporter, OPT family [Euryarchaeota archaeon]MBT6645689.1 oligopeptide transporter, OPT family [Euryarchaeota archaeon]
MSSAAEPYISASENPKELTIRVFAIGIILGGLMTAANAYLGLKVGMTVSASIPAAVMSMLILRIGKFEDVSILENNAVQTMASAGESLAAGVIFTVPALLVMGVWTEIQLVETFIIALLGGVLGTMFTIALRRVFIVEEALPYPEGVACREVLVAGEEGGSGLIAIVYALIIGALYGWFVKGFHITKELVQGATSFFGTRLYAGSELSLALLSVGYIVGLRIASFIFLGGVLGFMVLVPLYGMINGWPAGVDMTTSFMIIWNEQIRYVGVGAMVVGGVWTLIAMRATIKTGFKKALSAADEDGRAPLRTEMDLPMDKVLLTCGIITVLTFCFYWWATGSLWLALVGALFLAVAAFFFSTVAGYIAGVLGSSNSPVSGMTIATLMFTAAIVWVVGDLLLGMSTASLMTATLIIAAVVAVNAAIAGDVMQDLKTGHMLGATPWKQQIAEIVGVLVGAITIGPILMLLHKAFQITQTACVATNQRLETAWTSGGNLGATPDYYNCEEALLAPQAELIGAIINGFFGGSFNLPMVLIGAAIACIIIWKKMPVMAVAIGIYLPIFLSVPIVIGGLLHFFVTRITHQRIDGDLSGEPSTEAKAEAKSVTDKGILIGAGFIAGESLMGVAIAFFIVTWKHPEEWFEVIGTLGQGLSILFYSAFVAVFAFLATRSLPNSDRTIVADILSVLVDVGRRFTNALMPPK